MRLYLGDKAPALPGEVLEALMSHPWPGNIRELQNAVQRAAILSQGKTPKETDFLLSMNPQAQLESMRTGMHQPQTIHSMVEKEIIPSSSEDTTPLQIRSGMTVEEMEKALIFETLRATGNNRTEAAKMLGISIRTLRNKLHEYRGEEFSAEEL
jgi:two-component system response regulator FlrC